MVVWGTFASGIDVSGIDLQETPPLTGFVLCKVNGCKKATEIVSSKTVYSILYTILHITRDQRSER